MIAYRYSASAPTGRARPEADAIMDELARHVLENDSLEEAMRELCKKGVEQKYGDSLDGLNRLASKMLNLRRQALDRYTVEPLLRRLTDEIQSLLHRESEALRRSFSSEQDKIHKKADKFLDKAAGVVNKMERIRQSGKPGNSQALARLENTFEDLFLQTHEIEAEARALRKEEARRLDALKQVPENPGAALKELKGYKPADASVGETLASLSELADEIAAIERTHAQPGFVGSESVGLDEAAGLVERVLGMERVGSRLRKGNLSAADETLLADTSPICDASCSMAAISKTTARN
jgi:hypothetical protein